MRIIIGMFFTSFTLGACNEVLLRQPELRQSDTQLETQEFNYEIAGVDLTPAVVRHANSTPFQQLVVAGDDRLGPAKLLEPSVFLRRAPPLANTEFDYVLGTGDVLTLSRMSYLAGTDGIEREEVTSLDLHIAEGGYIELADGRQVEVVGLTVEQARQKIAIALIDSSERLADEVIELPFPKVATPDYEVGVGDVITISRLVRSNEDGEFVERLVTRPVKVAEDGTITILGIGTIEVIGLTTTQLNEIIVQEAMRTGLSADMLIDIEGFSSKSAMVTGDLGTKLIPITTEALTIDRLLVEFNPTLSREQDYLVRLERGPNTYQMRARKLLLEDERDQYPIFDSDRIIIERLARPPSFQLSVAEFRSQIVTFTGVGETGVNEVGETGVNEVVLTNQGLDLRRLLTQMGQKADRDKDILIRLFRSDREYRLSGQDVLLNSPQTRYWLKPNDHVIVEELVYTRNSALIIGAVGQPKRLEISALQRTTLSEALFGGQSQLSSQADFSHIYVIRGENSAYIAYHLDMRDVVRAGLAEQFELRPRDLVFVRARPISTLNEVLRMVLGVASSAAGLQDVNANASGD